MIVIPKHPGIYCRLSYAPDGSEEKVDRQEGDVRDLFTRCGWPQPRPEHVFKDNNRSAWKRDRKRPGWDRLLSLIKAGEIDGLGVYHGDRLIRQPFDLELLLQIADDHHIPLVSPSGARDLASEDDRFILRIEAAQACREAGNTSRRVRRAWAARAAEGRPVGGGKRPFGFEPDLVTRREGEAQILAEAAARLLSGQSQGGVIAWLNAVSTTSQGKPWSGRTFKNLLTAPRIAGLIAHDGTLHTAVWEPIISRDAWEDVKLLLARSAQEHPYQCRERRYLLGGVAECGTCEVPMRTKPAGGRNRRSARLYHCFNRDCPHPVGRSVTHLDAYVTGRTLRTLNTPAFIAGLYADDDQPGVAAEIAALERRRDEARATLEDLVDHPEVDPGLIARSLAGFDRRIKELRDARAAATSQRLLARMAGITRDQWEAEPLDVRAETVRTLYRVIVHPTQRRGPGFDPSAVELRRRS